MSNLAALRAKLQNAGTRERSTTKKSGGDNASFPFWNIDTGATATLRFLPDADTNDLFWVERQKITMPFSGVVGGDFPTDNEVTVDVPCVDMFPGMKCPVIAATKHMWDDPAKEDTARTYWKKRSFIFQGFVVNSPLSEDNAPENPIRRFVLNKTLYDIIFQSLMDPDLADMPTDYEGGRDFRISKTQNGKWADYKSSKFVMNPRSLSEFERSAIDQFGLHKLAEAKGAVPTPDAVDAIKAMYEDSIAGNPFDMEAYGQYYRPYGVKSSASTVPNRPVTAAKAIAAEAETPTVAASASASTTSSDEGSTNENAKAILDRLRRKSAV